MRARGAAVNLPATLLWQRQHIVLNDQPSLRRRVGTGGLEVGHFPIADFGIGEVAKAEGLSDPKAPLIDDNFQQQMSFPARRYRPPSYPL